MRIGPVAVLGHPAHVVGDEDDRLGRLDDLDDPGLGLRRGSSRRRSRGPRRAAGCPGRPRSRWRTRGAPACPTSRSCSGASMKSPRSAYSMIDGSSSRVTRVVEPEERATEQDVVAPGEVLVEAGAEGQQAGHVTADVDRALGRPDDPGEDLEQRALAGAVRSDDRERLAVERLAARRGGAPRTARPARARAIWPIDRADRRLLGEAQVVADAEVVDLDRVLALARSGRAAAARRSRSQDLREVRFEALEDRPSRAPRKSMLATSRTRQRRPVRAAPGGPSGSAVP